MDLGLGQPMEHVLRQCRIALALAERLALVDEERAVTYYVALIAWVGCHADAYEQAKWFGDDIQLKRDSYAVDETGLAPLLFTLRHLGAGQGPVGRARAAAAFASGGWRDVSAMQSGHCLIAGRFATLLGLGPEVSKSLQQVFERWDGNGVAGLRGTETSLPARIVILADVVEALHRASGAEAALSVAAKRRGTQFDPDLVDLLHAEAGAILGELDETSSWQAVIEAEPGLAVTLVGDRAEAALEAVGDFADLKSPYLAGRSRGVAGLVQRAAAEYGLPAADGANLRRAALIQDLGRLGISNAIWDRPGPLQASDMERVRIHPYLTERILASSATLSRLGRLAILHHERLDGSGYPAGLTADGIGPEARLLAAADAYHAMLEHRPQRPALDPDAAKAELSAEVTAGRLDGDAVSAVLVAAGHRRGRRRDYPAGLTVREVEVLRLLARGMTNREIADELVIARKTVSNHVEHIYAKLDVPNRAAASLFAAEHGLLGAERSS